MLSKKSCPSSSFDSWEYTTRSPLPPLRVRPSSSSSPLLRSLVFSGGQANALSRLMYHSAAAAVSAVLRKSGQLPRLNFTSPSVIAWGPGSAPFSKNRIVLCSEGLQDGPGRSESGHPGSLNRPPDPKFEAREPPIFKEQNCSLLRGPPRWREMRPCSSSAARATPPPGRRPLAPPPQRSIPAFSGDWDRLHGSCATEPVSVAV